MTLNNVHGETIDDANGAQPTKAPFFQLTMFCTIRLDAHEKKTQKELWLARFSFINAATHFVCRLVGR